MGQQLTHEGRNHSIATQQAEKVPLLHPHLEPVDLLLPFRTCSTLTSRMRRRQYGALTTCRSDRSGLHWAVSEPSVVSNAVRDVLPDAMHCDTKGCRMSVAGIAECGRIAHSSLDGSSKIFQNPPSPDSPRWTC